MRALLLLNAVDEVDMRKMAADNGQEANIERYFFPGRATKYIG